MKINEIDSYDYTTCPYNPSHRLVSQDKFISHIASCKDKQFPKVAATIQNCPYNSLHIFTDPQKLKYHTPRCREFPGRKTHYYWDPAQHCLTTNTWGTQRLEYEMVKCPMNPNHLIYKQAGQVALDLHISECPNSKHPWQPSNAAHLKTPRKPTDTSKPLILCYLTKRFQFLLRAESNFHLKEIWIDRFTFLDVEEWPGLRRRDSNRLKEFYIGKLFPTADSEGFLNIFKQPRRNMPSTKIAVCTQEAGVYNRVYLMVHKTEDRGLGSIVEETDLGLFCFPHSMLYGLPDTSAQIKAKNEELTEACKALKVNNEYLNKQLEEAFKNINTLKLEKSQVLTQLDQTKAEKEAAAEKSKLEILNLKKQTRELIKQMSKEVNQKINSLKTELEKEKQDKRTVINNYQADMQKFKSQSTKASSQKEVKISQLKSELQEKDKKIELLEETLAEKEEELEEVSQNTELTKKIRDNLEKEYQEKEMCTMCLVEKKDTLFIPCGHLLYCNLCLSELKLPINRKVSKNNPHSRCGACDREVTKVVKAFPY